MKVAIPKEVAPGETRVAATVATVKEFTKAAWQVAVEAGAGEGSFISDAQHKDAGATIERDPAALLGQADLVLKVQGPIVREGGLDEIAAMRGGAVLVCMLAPASNPQRIERLAAGGISAFALELVPRLSRAQSMDVLSSMSTLAGYKAVLMAADALGKIAPMMMTAAGTITPASCMVIGAGVAGLQAIATARRLGATVRAIDTRPAVKEQVESLGARFVHLEVAGHKAEGTGGYARDLGEAFYKDEQDVIAPHLEECDMAVTTALIPNRAAPVLITGKMVERMRPGSVIVDLAVTAGGNCSLTRPDQRVSAHNVTILGPTNLPALVPVHASQMFARNVAAFLRELVKDGRINVDPNNEILAAMLVAHGGQVQHPRVVATLPPKDGTS